MAYPHIPTGGYGPYVANWPSSSYYPKDHTPAPQLQPHYYAVPHQPPAGESSTSSRSGDPVYPIHQTPYSINQAPYNRGLPPLRRLSPLPLPHLPPTPPHINHTGNAMGYAAPPQLSPSTFAPASEPGHLHPPNIRARTRANLLQPFLQSTNVLALHSLGTRIQEALETQDINVVSCLIKELEGFINYNYDGHFLQDFLNLLEIKSASILLGDLNKTHALDPQTLQQILPFLDKSEARFRALDRLTQSLMKDYRMLHSENGKYLGMFTVRLKNEQFVIRQSLISLFRSICALRLKFPAHSENDVDAATKAQVFLINSKKILEPYLPIVDHKIQSALLQMNIIQNIVWRQINNEPENSLHTIPTIQTTAPWSTSQ